MVRSVWKVDNTVNNQDTNLKKNNLGHFPVACIHKNFHLEEIRTSS